MLQRLIKWFKMWVFTDVNAYYRYYYANGDEIITIGHQMLLELVTPNELNMEETTVTTTELAVRPKTYYATSTTDTMILEPYVTKRSGLPTMRPRRIPIMTIAAIFDHNTYIMKYGISICSYEDDFNAKRGRKMAKERMEQGFAQIRYSSKPILPDVTAEQAKEFVETTVANIIRIFEDEVVNEGKLHSKFERRIDAFNKSLIQAPVVV